MNLGSYLTRASDNLLVPHSTQLTLLEKCTLTLIILTPLGYFVIPGWLSTSLFIAALLSFWSLSVSKTYWEFTSEAKVCSLIFVAYPLVILLSQLCRWEWRLHDYHDQSRFLLALPIFLFLLKKNLNVTKLFTLSLPLITIGALISAYWLNSTTHWGTRLSVSFIDPLAFGFINLSMALLCLSAMTFLELKVKNTPLFIWLSLGFLAGTILSIQSQSRTGLLSLLIVPPMLICFRIRLKLRIALPILVLTSITIGSALFFTSSIVHSRIVEAYQDFVTYPWHGKLDHMTSLGWRITFWRVGWFYFTQSPLWGWGDKGFVSLMNSPEITVFASKEAIQFCYDSLFHNELITQAVRYGLLGIGGTFFIFGYGGKIFWQYRNLKDATLISPAVMGLSYLICQLIAGISDEVFNLKHLVSISGFILACTLALTLNLKKQKILN